MKWTKDLKRSRNTLGARSIFIFSAVSGVIAGLGSLAMIAVINSILARGTSKEMVWSFVGLCLMIPLSGFFSQALLIRLTAQATRNLRVRLSRQILSAPYRLLEELGIHRLLGIITDDITSVTNGITSLPFLSTQIAVIIGCLIYLGWLSPPLVLLVIGYMVLGIFSYRLPIIKSVHHYRRMRESWDASFKGFQALTEGIKELKLNRSGREAFMAQELEPAINAVYRHGVLASTIATAASNWGQALFFLLIGLSLFLGPLLPKVNHQVLTGYALAVLFMIAPLSGVLGTMPVLARAHVAAEKVDALGLSLAAASHDAETPIDKPRSWNQLSMDGIIYIHRQNGSPEEFQLGPLDFRIHAGEIVFITGGNGSGKTTFAKLLIGLYEPCEGTIALDGKAVLSEDLDSYRQLFSVVFYDFYLFERLYGLNHGGAQENIEKCLKLLQLSHKLRIKNGKLSTTELSQGQRKRLALLAAYLADRPIYVFDEWASDQDPAFKQIFYGDILPALKARGKAVIVISHDDRYYRVADRIVKLERGKIEYDIRREPSVVAGKDSRVIAPLGHI